MPAIFRKAFYHDDIVDMVQGGKNPPTLGQKKCIRDLVVRICAGQEPIYSHPNDKRWFYPKVGCDHKIFLKRDRQGNLYVRYIVPYEPPI